MAGQNLDFDGRETIILRAVASQNLIRLEFPRKSKRPSIA